MTTTNIRAANARDTRYRTLLPVERLQSTPISIIGCGAIGRQVAIQLASMGCRSLLLVDFDDVSAENLGPQGWAPCEIGRKKVDALAETLVRLNPECEARRAAVRFDIDHLEDVVFCCVDSMTARREIFDRFQGDALSELFIEARMGAENFQVRTVRSREEGDRWLADWFPQEEAKELPCTARATLYNSAVCAGVMVASFMQWLRAPIGPPYLVNGNLSSLSFQVTD